MSGIKRLLRDSDPAFRAVLVEAYKLGLAAGSKPRCQGCGQPKICSRDGLCTECHAYLVGPYATFHEGVSHADHSIEV
jgi:hypothetical protein